MYEGRNDRVKELENKLKKFEKFHDAYVVFIDAMDKVREEIWKREN